MLDDPLAVLYIPHDKSDIEATSSELQKHGYDLTFVDDIESALNHLQKQYYSIVVSDLELPESQLIELLSRARALQEGVEVLFRLNNPDLEVVQTLVRHGVADVIQLSRNHAELLFTLKKIEERAKLRFQTPTRSKAKSNPFANLIANSAKMAGIFDIVKRLAPFKTTILISGESGTGKELIAKAIHDSSTRAHKPFVAVNCGAIPEHLIEAEFFGHKRGSFTDAINDRRGLFEEADGGTIFLDEIGDLPLHLQVKLLRVLQEQQIRRIGEEHSMPVDVRVLVATNRDLEDDVMTGKFREDLFFRLNVVAVELPPLRARPEDVGPLVRHFIKKHNKRLGTSIKGISDDALDTLKRYSWKGNIRELENCVERAIVLSDAEVLTKDQLPAHIVEFSAPLNSEALSPTNSATVHEQNLSIKDNVREIEMLLIKRALTRTNGNRTHAAKILEISHRTLLYKLKEFNIQ